MHPYTVVQRNPMVPFATEYFEETEFAQLENDENRSGNSGDEFCFISDEDFGWQVANGIKQINLLILTVLFLRTR